MYKLPYAESYRNLIVYQKAKETAHEIFQLTKSFPKEEMFSLTDQIRRFSRSIGAQIAEAWAKRDYEKHFQSKLTDADAERQVTQHWIDIAFDCEYLSETQTIKLKGKLDEIGRLIGGMIAKSELFCSPHNKRVGESREEYFVRLDTDDE